MVRFVDANRDEFGVEPICTTLEVAPSTYYDNKKRLPSARAIRDAVMMPVLLALFEANYSVYGVRKLWIAATRDGHDIGRDQVGRLMKQLGIQGVSRRMKVRTTIADKLATRPEDLVDRDFTADAPNRLWVSDLTYVPTWNGMGCMCVSSSTHSHDALWGGVLPAICEPQWSSTLLRWHVGSEAPVLRDW